MDDVSSARIVTAVGVGANSVASRQALLAQALEKVVRF
jgi:hypothetical protein